MKINIAVKIGKLRFKNPVLVSSGTFGYGEEFNDFIDLRKLGGIVTKTITLKPRKGNPPPRTCETDAGMLNSIGLENPGFEAFIEQKMPVLRKSGVPIIVSIASEGDTSEFVVLAKKLDKLKAVAAIELNISCPNIKHSKLPTPMVRLRPSTNSGRVPSVVEGRSPLALSEVEGANSKLISQDPKATYDIVKRVRQVTSKTLITKLSPNVTDLTEIAVAAEKAGSDAVALINTLTGMSIDTDTRKPKIASVVAGLSGPAIRPVAVRMVWEAFQKIKIPIIGMGGIFDTDSALEFIIAGASAISIGTANFINPRVSIEIINGLKGYLARNKLPSIKELRGSLHR